MRFDPEERMPSAASKQETLLPELLHALSQPLTALRCSLELTLHQPRDSEEYRRRLRESLGLAEEVTTLASGIRELLEAEKPARGVKEVDFTKLVRMIFRDFLPVGDDRGIGLNLISAAGLIVIGGEYEMSKAVFHLLDFVLGTASRGDDVNVQLSGGETGIDLVLEMIRGSDRSGLEQPHTRAAAKSYVAFLIARRIFEVAGGVVQVKREPNHTLIQVTLQAVVHKSEHIATQTHGACKSA
jgi:hypothetical protein